MPRGVRCSAHARTWPLPCCQRSHSAVSSTSIAHSRDDSDITMPIVHSGRQFAARYCASAMLGGGIWS